MKRATVYFDPQLHRALRIKAAETDRSISELVNEAIRQSLLEDMEDIAADDLRPPGREKLTKQERYRVRQGWYRIVYAVDDPANAVVGVKVGHRRDVYHWDL